MDHKDRGVDWYVDKVMAKLDAMGKEQLDSIESLRLERGRNALEQYIAEKGTSCDLGSLFQDKVHIQEAYKRVAREIPPALGAPSLVEVGEGLELLRCLWESGALSTVPLAVQILYDSVRIDRDILRAWFQLLVS